MNYTYKQLIKILPFSPIFVIVTEKKKKGNNKNLGLNSKWCNSVLKLFFSTKDGRVIIKQHTFKVTHYEAFMLCTFTRIGTQYQLLLRFFGSSSQAHFLITRTSSYLKLPKFNPRKATSEELLFLLTVVAQVSLFIYVLFLKWRYQTPELVLAAIFGH